MIAIILPTRGLVYAEVEQAIEDLRLNYSKVTVLRTWNKKLPEAQNFLVEQALFLKDLTHLLFIEEDTVPPIEGVLKMIKANVDIACIDYSVGGWSCITRQKTTKEILWCGMGCTLIHKRVFDKIERPWFRIDRQLRLNDNTWIDVPNKYGGQDIWFCDQARRNGFKIIQIDGECKHLQIKALGRSGYNSGLHDIIVRNPIKNHQYLDYDI